MHQIDVSEGALLRRVNRRLSREEWPRAVRRCREDSRAYSNLGRFHIVDCYRNIVVDSRVDLEALARELGVMGGAEQLRADG